MKKVNDDILVDGKIYRKGQEIPDDTNIPQKFFDADKKIKEVKKDGKTNR
jgi:hypothetical protein